jgi:hypothetical protein
MNANNFLAEERFYSEPFFLSYSGLNKLLYSPKVFYNQYVLGIKEERLDSHLIEGKLIHSMILEEDFDSQFILGPEKVPADNAKIIVDTIWNKAKTDGFPELDMTHFQDTILELMVTLNYYQNLKTDAQRLEKIFTDANKAYYNFLQKQSGKTLISQETYDKCLDIVNEVLSNKEVITSLGIDCLDCEILSEHYLTSSVGDYPFYIKGYLDRIVIDKKRRVIRICDFKTTAKPIDKFKDTIEYFKYNHQAAIYLQLINKYLEMNQEDKWKVEFHFIVVDLFKQVYVFPVSNATMIQWDAMLMTDIDKFAWHFVNKNFTLPYDLAKEKIIL